MNDLGNLSNLELKDLYDYINFYKTADIENISDEVYDEVKFFEYPDVYLLIKKEMNSRGMINE